MKRVSKNGPGKKLVKKAASTAKSGAKKAASYAGKKVRETKMKVDDYNRRKKFNRTMSKAKKLIK